MRSEASTLHEAVLEALPCEVIVHDVDTIVVANVSACRALGAPSPRSLVGLPFSALTGRISGDEDSGKFNLIADGGHTAASRSMTLTRLSGENFSIGVLARRFDVGDKSYSLVVGTERDMCVRPEAWDAEVPCFPGDTPLHAAALDALPLPVTAYDAEGFIIYANAAATAVFDGGTGTQLVGSPMSAVVHPHGRHAARERRRMVIDQGQSFSGIEVKLQTLAGEAMKAVVSLGRTRMPDGEKVGFWVGQSVEPVGEINGAAAS